MTHYHSVYHISRIQRRLQRRSIPQRIYHALFPNRISLIVAVTFTVFCIWLALGAPMP